MYLCSGNFAAQLNFMVIMMKKSFDLKRCLHRIHYLELVSDPDDEFDRIYVSALQHARNIILDCVDEVSDEKLLDIVVNGD